jgi:hypothetical protein
MGLSNAERQARWRVNRDVDLAARAAKLAELETELAAAKPRILELETKFAAAQTRSSLSADDLVRILGRYPEQIAPWLWRLGREATRVLIRARWRRLRRLARLIVIRDGRPKSALVHF